MLRPFVHLLQEKIFVAAFCDGWKGEITGAAGAIWRSVHSFCPVVVEEGFTTARVTGQNYCLDAKGQKVPFEEKKKSL